MKALAPTLLLLLICAACAPLNPNTATTDGGAGQDPTSSGGDSGSSNDAHRTEGGGATAGAGGGPGVSAASGRWPSGGVRVTTMLARSSGGLMIGYDGGGVVDVEPASKTLRARQLQGATGAILAFSPDGELATLGGEPATLLALDSGAVVLELNRIGRVTASAFSEDGKRWFAADATGKLHVFTRAKLMATKDGDDLRSVLTRQQPDFTAALGKIEGLWTIGETKVLFADEAGDVLQWDIVGQDLDTLVSLETQLQTISHNARYIAIVATGGQMRLLDRSKKRVVPWSARGQATDAALSATDASWFYTTTKDRLQARASNTGEPRWETPIPEGDPCGLRILPKSNLIALCRGNTIAFYGAANGKLASYLVRTPDQKVAWIQPNGAPVK